MKEKSNNKQTAVDWLYLKLSTSSSEEMVGNINVWFEQAKAMHKEEIINAHFEGQCDETEVYPLEIAKKFYNETYGGNK